MEHFLPHGLNLKKAIFLDSGYWRQGSVCSILRMELSEKRNGIPKILPEPKIEKWIRFKTDYWAGETGYLELTTNGNHPVEAGNAERSWFGVTEAFHATHDEPALKDEISEILSPLFSTFSVTNSRDLTILYKQVIKDAIKAWGDNSISDAQSRILNLLIKEGILPNSQKEIPTVKNLVLKYREIESLIKAPRLAPGLLDGEPLSKLYLKEETTRNLHIKYLEDF